MGYSRQRSAKNGSVRHSHRDDRTLEIINTESLRLKEARFWCLGGLRRLRSRLGTLRTEVTVVPFHFLG